MPYVTAQAADSVQRPNVVLILADDMGFSDLGCYGGEIPTPNLDRLAENGLRFTQFRNTGRCCPTRASLLTGLYSHQAGIGHMMEDRGTPGYRGRLNDRCATLAEVLRPAGWFTAVSGKWHVGQEQGVVPWERGFDRNLNAVAGGFYRAESPRAKLFLNGAEIPNDDPRLPADWYSTDLWTDFGLKFIDEAQAADKPFFLYLPYNAPHFPLQASAEDIARFRGTYKAGWDKLAAARFDRQRRLGLFGDGVRPAPRPEQVQAFDTLSPAEQDRFDHLMATYAATVFALDRAVGRLVTELRRRNCLDDTLIVFLSDNGGSAESGPKGRTDGDPTKAASQWFCGASWAWVQNTPYRRSKAYVHEGGIASPLIVHWPAAFPPVPGTNRWVHQPAHVIDLLPTLAAAAGATYPAELAGKPLLPLEGRDLLPACRGEVIPRDALFWEHSGNAAVRVGDFKLVRAGRKGDWELYDLRTDPTETHDLAAKRPEQVRDLTARWNAWALRCHVVGDAARPGGKP